jgi:hypothetical protein
MSEPHILYIDRPGRKIAPTAVKDIKDAAITVRLSARHNPCRLQKLVNSLRG